MLPMSENKDTDSDLKVEEKFLEKMDENSDVNTEKIKGNAKLEGLENIGNENKLQYPWFLNRVANRIQDGYSPVIVVTGGMREGKSEVAQTILHYLHNKTDVLLDEIDQESIKDHLAYNVLDFMDFIIENRRKGIIVDEAGSVLNSGNHRSKYNRTADEVIQTMAYKNNVYIFIAPKFTDIDKKVRTQADIVLEVRKRGLCIVRGVQTNYGKIRTGELDLRKKPLPPWTPDRPPKKIRIGYDEKEKKFKDNNLEEKRKEIAEELDENDGIDFDVNDLI